ncbi:hypothetical protein GOP47_0012629 [Adiantum capillus-veneris]|uniref:Uncharacterized protein n=1 Tax=Adiantum capillus-veneris TaxID=13818 RepID=A0A9D4UR19_ADICA|nr:hypothetical protein GOP47_0012629 [Adiantum capillus-veneris]
MVFPAAFFKLAHRSFAADASRREWLKEKDDRLQGLLVAILFTLIASDQLSMPREECNAQIVEETEVYRTAGVSQLNHSPWCPHQGLYEHISLTFEELMNLGHGYADSLRSSLHRRRICPYLVGVHSIPIHSSHTENSSSFGRYNSDGSSSHNVPSGAHHVHQSRLAMSSHNGSWVPYARSYRTDNQNAPDFNPNHSRQTIGLLLESSQSTYARFGEEADARGQQSSHRVHNQVDQMISRHSHPRTVNGVWNAYANSRRARHSEVITGTRHLHNYYAQTPQMTESTMNGYPSWVGPYSSHHPSMVPYADGAHWASVGSHIAYGMPAYWWAWPPVTNPSSRAGRTIW